MKSSDITLSIVIIIVFVLLFMVNILSVGIKKIEDNKCIVTVGGDSEDSKIFERDLLSEINQSLS